MSATHHFIFMASPEGPTCGLRVDTSRISKMKPKARGKYLMALYINHKAFRNAVPLELQDDYRQWFHGVYAFASSVAVAA